MLDDGFDGWWTSRQLSRSIQIEIRHLYFQAGTGATQ